MLAHSWLARKIQLSRSTQHHVRQHVFPDCQQTGLSCGPVSCLLCACLNVSMWDVRDKPCCSYEHRVRWHRSWVIRFSHRCHFTIKMLIILCERWDLGLQRFSVTHISKLQKIKHAILIGQEVFVFYTKLKPKTSTWLFSLITITILIPRHSSDKCQDY